MAFHCMNCAGHMVFDVASQKMRCEHCGATCEPTELKLQEDAIMTEHITCQNCGAELEGTEDSLVGFCPYCGGQSLVRGEGETYAMEAIIPFKVTKESCVERYGAYTKGVPYLAKEFKDTSYLEKFLGIYMPYHAYDVALSDISAQGKTTRETRRTTETKTYEIAVELEGQYRMGAPYDASKYLDDELSDRVMPFDVSERKVYHPAYLSGFYADASTTPWTIYAPDAAEQAVEEVQSLAISRVQKERSNMHSLKGLTGTGTVFDHHTELFPYWFINWRKGDRIAYAAINGQTGKVISDLPLNMSSFALGCLVVSAALFLVLELTMEMTPGFTAFLSMIAAALMALSVHNIARRLHDLETKDFDKGFNEDAEMEALRLKRRHHNQNVFTYVVGGIVALCVAFGAIYALIDIDRAFNPRTSPLLKITPLIVGAICVYVLIRVLSWHRDLKEWNSPLAISLELVSVVVCALCIFIAPVHDIFYYLAAIVTDIGLITSSVALIRAYNESTTRPVPKIFDREEV